MNEPTRVTTQPPNLGHRHRLFGWSLFLVGILYGLALGSFVFDGPVAAPERFADYASLPRRLIRFAHIACMALGMVNVLYGHEIDRLRVSDHWRRIGSGGLILAGTLMPVLLTLSAFQIGWKWGLPLPGLAALLSVAVLVAGLARKETS